MEFTVQRRRLEFVNEPGILPTAFSLLLANMLTVRAEDQLAIDAGAGSGIQAIILALLGVPKIVAVEASSRACEIMEANCLRNGVADRVEIFNGRIEELELANQVDLIVANPPTIPPGPEVPYFAYGGGPDGLDFLRELVLRSSRWARPSGTMQIALSSLVSRDTFSALLVEEQGMAEEVGSFILPMRHFYRECYSEKALKRMIRDGDVIAGGGGELSEVVTILECCRLPATPVDRRGEAEDDRVRDSLADSDVDR